MKRFLSFMGLGVSLLFVFFILLACKNEQMNSSFLPAGSPEFSAEKKSYLALGDSYTIGEEVGVEERFPNQLVAALHEAGLYFNEPKIIAQTGWTTQNLLAAIETASPAHDYDLVTLLIGVNNQYQHKSIEEYKSDFSLLLKKAIQFAGNRKSNVVVISIPDYAVTPFAGEMNRQNIAKEIDAFNNLNEQLSFAQGISYLNITAISRNGATDPSLQAKDGLHPSGKQYRQWVALLAPIVLQKWEY